MPKYYLKRVFVFFAVLALFFFFSSSPGYTQTIKDFTVNHQPGQKQIDLGEIANIDIWNLPKKNVTYTLSLQDGQRKLIDKLTIQTSTDGTCTVTGVDDTYKPLLLGRHPCESANDDSIGFNLDLNTDDLSFNRSLKDYSYILVLSGGNFGQPGVTRGLPVHNQNVQKKLQVKFELASVQYIPGATSNITISGMRKLGDETQYIVKGKTNNAFSSDLGNLRNIFIYDDGECEVTDLATTFDGAWPKGECTGPDSNGNYTYTGTINVYAFTNIKEYFDRNSDIGSFNLTLSVYQDTTSSDGLLHEATLTVTGQRKLTDTCDPEIQEGEPGYTCQQASRCEPIPDTPARGTCERIPNTAYIELPNSGTSVSTDKDTGFPIPIVDDISGDTITLKAGGLLPNFCYYITINQLAEGQVDGAMLRPGADSFAGNPNILTKEDYQASCDNRAYYSLPVTALSPLERNFKDSYPELIDKYPNVFAVFDGNKGTEQEIKIPMLQVGAYSLRLYNVGTSGFGSSGKSSDDGLAATQKILVGTGALLGTALPSCTEIVIKDNNDKDSDGNGKLKRLRVNSNDRQAYEKLFADEKYEFVKCAEVQTAIGPFRTDPREFITTLMGFLLGISGGIVILLIIRAGYIIMTSRADPEKIAEAKEILTSAIVGLLFIIFSLVILEIIGVDVLKIPGFCREGAVCQDISSENDAPIIPLPTTLPVK